MKSEDRRGPSMKPQQLHGGRVWYYERRGSIEVIVNKDAPKLGSGSEDCRVVVIPKRMLLASLERMGR